MAREKEGLQVMSKLVIASAKEVGMVMAAMGIWTAGVSAVNNASKSLKNLHSLGQLEAGKGFYRWPGCRSEWGGHAQTLSNELARILCKYPQSVVRREILVPHLSRRADALIGLRRGNEMAVIVYECTVSENRTSYENKKNEWLSSRKQSQPFLSEQFGVDVPDYSILGSHDLDEFLRG